jgi:hypothetical protein
MVHVPLVLFWYHGIQYKCTYHGTYTCTSTIGTITMYARTVPVWYQGMHTSGTVYVYPWYQNGRVPWYIPVVRLPGTYTCTYVRTYVRTYHGIAVELEPQYTCTYVRTCVRTNVRTYVLIMLCHNVRTYPCTMVYEIAKLFSCFAIYRVAIESIVLNSQCTFMYVMMCAFPIRKL